MSEYATGVFAAIVVIGLLFLSFGVGIEAAQDRISEECANYGAAKVDGKLYECRLK